MNWRGKHPLPAPEMAETKYMRKEAVVHAFERVEDLKDPAVREVCRTVLLGFVAIASDLSQSVEELSDDISRLSDDVHGLSKRFDEAADKVGA